MNAFMQASRKAATAPLSRPAATGAVLQRQSDLGRKPPQAVPSLVHEVLRSSGQPLDPTARAFFEPRFGQDFSQVRVHAGTQAAASARSVGALAYAVGRDVVFGQEQYRPGSAAGLHLLAHELAHVVQQDGGGMERNSGIAMPTGGEAQETEAEQAADAVTRGTMSPPLRPIGGPAIQRRVEMRNVGRGEQSGFARLPELVDRLNAMSQGLTFSLNGQQLAYEVRPGGTLSNFDRQMMAFIDQDPVVPLRLTNRHGLLGNKAAGFHDQVDVDAWTSGYVDIDDLLASTDLGLQSVLVHFIQERSATSNYARRIGTSTFTQAEFTRVHGEGIEAEAQLLRDFFNDPTIRIISDSPSPTIRRVFRNRRGDRIRRRVTRGRGAERGVDAMSIEVVTRDGVTHTAEEYRRILEEERIAAQVERERLGGADEHREGGRGVPAP